MIKTREMFSSSKTSLGALVLVHFVCFLMHPRKACSTNEQLHNKSNYLSVVPGKNSSVCLVFALHLIGSYGVQLLHADSENSDLTGWMMRLICGFAGSKLKSLDFSHSSSNIK